MPLRFRTSQVLGLVIEKIQFLKDNFENVVINVGNVLIIVF